MNEQDRELMDAQESQQLRSTSAQVGMRAAAEHSERTVHNEQFLKELRKTGLEDSEAFGWLEEEFPTWFAPPRTITNRGETWDKQADLLMQNKRERAVAEGRPGRLLRDRPFALATMRDSEPPVEAYQDGDIPGDAEYWHERVLRSDKETFRPITSEEQSRIYGAAEVAADKMALSRNGAGLDSVSTVKTETSVNKQREDEGTASRVGRMLE